jgi:hypothetical protein
LMYISNVRLPSRCMPRYFTSFFWGRSTLPIFVVGQVWFRRVNVICVDLIRFILILHFFAQSITLLLAWSFIQPIAGTSCVTKITASLAMAAFVVLSVVGRSLV